MALLIESTLRSRAQRETSYYKSAATILNEHMQKQAAAQAHDIFMSHAFEDRELVLGATLTLEDFGYSVYLDWRDDPTLDRKNVSENTADRLRQRMRGSRCLHYATTQSSSNSKWMPWELGFKDGHNTRAAILPIMSYTTETFSGQEYLGLYPYLSEGRNTAGQNCLWVHRTKTCYVAFDEWLNGADPAERS